MSEYIEVRDKLIVLEDNGKQETEEFKKLDKKWRVLRERGFGK